MSQQCGKDSGSLRKKVSSTAVNKQRIPYGKDIIATAARQQHSRKGEGKKKYNKRRENIIETL